MTRDEVLAMAEQAGAVTYSPPPMRAVRGLSFEFDQLERFAAIVAAAEREECAKDKERMNKIRGGLVYIEPQEISGSVYVATDREYHYAKTDDEINGIIDRARSAK